MQFARHIPVAPLFMPGDKPALFAKGAASGADALILDLEDAVAPDSKAAARAAVVARASADSPVIVRINAIGTPWFEADLAALVRCPPDAIMVPKADSRAALAEVHQRLGQVLPLIPLIETAAGLGALADLLSAPGVAVAAFGSLDFALDLDCLPEWEALLLARSELVLRSRLAGLPAPIDGVTPQFNAPELLQAEAERARGLGFGGKLAIHPRQIMPIRAAMLPTQMQVDWAEQVLAGLDSGAVAQVNGAMVDAPVIARARRILARAGIDRA